MVTAATVDSPGAGTNRILSRTPQFEGRERQHETYPQRGQSGVYNILEILKKIPPFMAQWISRENIPLHSTGKGIFY